MMNIYLKKEKMLPLKDYGPFGSYPSQNRQAGFGPLPLTAAWAQTVFQGKHLLLLGFVFCFLLQPVAAQETLFDDGWRFAFGNASSPEKDFGRGTEYFNYYTKAASIHNTGPYAVDFDDSAWKPVQLPHDWVVDLPFAPEASHSHGYKTVGWKWPETSVGWYRKHFQIPADALGKPVSLRFDGIFRDSDIWVNGFWLGGEQSGYTTATYNIAEYLNYGWTWECRS